MEGPLGVKQCDWIEFTDQERWKFMLVEKSVAWIKINKKNIHQKQAQTFPISPPTTILLQIHTPTPVTHT